MIIVVNPDGTLTMVYTEAVDLSEVGPAQYQRASHVEPSSDGWEADLSPVEPGLVLGPFTKRSEALAAEAAWLDTWLQRGVN